MYFLCLRKTFPLPPSIALAASGGQLPLSSLDGSNKLMLGASGCQGGGLPSSLFLNHPALLHMGQNPGAGLLSSAVAKGSSSFPSASSISPTPCSPSPCSSPISSCSSSEMAHSPASLDGAKMEWPRQGPIREEEEMRKWEPRLSHQSYLFLSCALLFRIFSPPTLAAAAAAVLFFSFSPDLSMPKIHRMKEERQRKGGKRGGQREERGWSKPKIFIYPKNRLGEATWDLFFLCQ